MSAIFGCIALDGQPLSSEFATVMARAMERWGPDGVRTVGLDGAVLGAARLVVSPEAAHASMPREVASGRICCTAAARLDNRDELLSRMRVPPGDQPTMSDESLLLHAYETWGEEALTRLFGDWALAVWDSRKRGLFLARDHLGNTGMYYSYQPPLFAFASDPEAILALPGFARQIDERSLASYVTVFGLGNEDDTCWANIRVLLQGHTLVLTPQGPRISQYWEMKERPGATGVRDEEYAAGFLEHFRTAVTTRLRCRGPVGTTLSAGLDSSAVTALAADILAARGEALPAFTSTPCFAAGHLVGGALADEWPLAGAVAKLYPNIDHQAVNAANISPLAGVERTVALAHAPWHAAANMFWILALLEQARRQGIRVLLTGQLGNGTVSWSGGGDRILWLLLSGKWDEGRTAMARWKQRNGRSWPATIAAQVVKPLLRPWWKYGKRLLQGGSPWAEYAAIHPDFAKRIGLAAAMKAAGHGSPRKGLMPPFEQRWRTVMPNARMAGPVWHLLGTAYGMEVRDPTADVRLLEFCLSVPDEQQILDGGQRMLIRRAMTGFLPPEVQWNTVRGRQAADVALRLLRHPQEMEAVLSRLAGHPEVIRYLDVDEMRRVWRDLQARVTPRTASAASTLLLRGIMCGHFIEDAGRLGRA